MILVIFLFTEFRAEIIMKFAAGTAGAGGPHRPKVVRAAVGQNVIVADNARATCAALDYAEELGFNTLLLSTFIEGEAREVARVHAAMAREIAWRIHQVP